MPGSPQQNNETQAEAQFWAKNVKSDFPHKSFFIGFSLVLVGLNLFGAYGFNAMQESNGEHQRLVALQDSLKVRVAGLETKRVELSDSLDTVLTSTKHLGELYNYQEPVSSELAVAPMGGPEGIDEKHLSPSPELFFSIKETETSHPAPLVNAHEGSLLVFAENYRAKMSVARKQLADVESHIAGVLNELNHIPSIRPVDSKWYSSPFGDRISPITGQAQFHSGLDIVADIGDKVYAPADGVVRYAGVAGGMGRMVEIEHGNGFKTRFGHNSRLNVRAGEIVKRGDVIARIGMTGNTTGPHCHYVVIKDDQFVNPRDYISEK